MSLSVKKLKPVLVLDKRLGFETQREFGVIKSGVSNTYKVLPTANSSTASTQFNIQPPSENIAINREIILHFVFQITFTGTSGALPPYTLLYPGLYDAPRAFPLNQIIQSIEAQINNANVSMNNYQLINAFSRLNVSSDELRRDFSSAPSMVDTYPNYDDPYTFGYGIANDPLQNYGQNSYFNPRGSYPITVISNPPQTGPGQPCTATIQFETFEPLILSPFLSGGDNNTAFIGVQSLVLQLNFLAGNLARIWSHSAGAGNAGTIVGQPVVTFVGQPECLLNFITPNPLQDRPLTNVYGYNTVNPQFQDLNISVSPGQTVTINSNNIQFNYIPRRILVFVQRSQQTTDFTTTDTFMRINSCSINFDNISGILSGANSLQLWNLSKNSGLNMTWVEWNTFVGSILVLDVGRTLMLQNTSTEAPSLTISKQFQISLSVTNLNPTQSITPTLMIATIADGIITVEGNTAVLQSTVLTESDILDAGNSTEAAKAWERSSNWFGGRMLEHSKKLVHRLKNMQSKSTGGADIGGDLGDHELVGGAKMSKKSLGRRLKY